MRNLDQHAVIDATLTLENEYAFYNFFLEPYFNNLKKHIKKDVYNKDKAINGLQDRIKAFFNSCKNMDVCRYKYKYIPTVYYLTKIERIEVAKNLIESFEINNL